MPNPIRGDGCLLEVLRATDVTPAYVAWMNDPEVIRFLTPPARPYSRESLIAYVAARLDSGTDLLCAIRTADGRRHIGNIKLGGIDPHLSRGDIGIVLGDRAFWGRGYATRAIAAMTRHAHCVLGLDWVIAGCHHANAGSWRAFEKAGFSDRSRQLAAAPGSLPWMTGVSFDEKVMVHGRGREPTP